MQSALRNYGLVTAAYWGFTLTDGALRMLVLLHFYELGFSAFEIALLFVLYECAGVITNMLGGWLAQTRGLRFTLFAGLILQILSLAALAATDPAWRPFWSVIYVMGLQAISGIAKDLTKMSSKAAIRVLVPANAQSALFRWVAILTGSKNALKGAGFFLGGALLGWAGFAGALIVMAGGLLLVLLAIGVSLRDDMAGVSGKTGAKFRDMFSNDRRINALSAARLFLFGARDIWFVVGLPVFLSADLGWDHIEVGAYLAFWVIGYGIIQAGAPAILRLMPTSMMVPRPKSSQPAPGGRHARFWIGMLTIITAIMALALHVGIVPHLTVLVGLMIFGAVFAINSSLHSYLVLAYADGDRLAMNVGFYYMSNAIGRLAGTVLSGLAYMYGGLAGCLVASTVFLLAGWAISFALPAPRTATPTDPA